MASQPFVILMAEDNAHDILATQRAWELHNITNSLYIVTDGEACLDYLHQRGPYAIPGSAPRPSILLLDLNLPKLDGLSVLEHIRTAPQLQRLPVIVLTTSKLEEDRIRSYDLGANAYIRKPIGFENFAEALRAIHVFWQMVDLPE